MDEFLAKHPFGSQSDSFEKAKSWLNSPQTLLTIGIIQMLHENGFKEAEETLNRVLADGHEFAAEAFYYKACMRIFSSMTKNIKRFEEDIKKAIEFFFKSRTAFSLRLQRKQREAACVAKMVEKLPENNPKTSGYGSQIKAITTYLNLVIVNIDYLLGTPCQENMFAGDGLSEEYSKQVHDSLIRQGFISSILLTEHPLEQWQVSAFREKYKLDKNQIEVNFFN